MFLDKYMNEFIKYKTIVIELKKLRKNIFAESDLILFDESFKCFSQKAIRSAYIMVWICIAESLRSKIAELSFKDKEASKVLRRIQDLEQQSTPQDKLILDKSHNLGLINNDEYKKLEHIRDMRNSYAHPTGAAPSIQEIDLAFHQAVEFVLSRPPQLKHGYVKGLIESIFFNRHFLEDNDVKINEYASTISPRLHPDVLPFLFTEVCEALKSCTDDLIKRRAMHFVWGLLETSDSLLSDSKWGIVNLIDKYSKIASTLLCTPIIWKKLPDQAQTMCFGNLAEPTKSDGSVQKPSAFKIKRLIILKNNDCLTEKQLEKLEIILQEADYMELIQANVSLGDIIEHIIKELKKHNYYVQNPAIIMLKKFSIKDISDLKDELQLTLGRNILQSADGGATSAIGYIRSYLLDQEEVPSFLLIGLLKECFTNEKLEFRVKYTRLDDVLNVVLKQKHPNSVLKKVIDDIEKSTATYSYKKNDLNQALIRINECLPKSSRAKKYFTNLRSILIKTQERLLETE